MYVIQKQPKVLSAKKSIDQTTSLGLGFSILQLILSLYRLSQFGCKDEESLLFGESTKSQEKGTGDLVICGTTKDVQKASEETLPSSKAHLPIVLSQQELGSAITCIETKQTWCFIIGVMLYAQLFLVIVDTYLYRFLLRATQKENMANCWLGLYLQISILTYDVAEILIVAHNGVLDGTSVLLGARATFRALSIEMIYLFLREIEDKQETDVFLYIILNV